MMSNLWPEFERGLREYAMSIIHECTMCEIEFTVKASTGDYGWSVDYCPYCGDDLSEQAYDNDQWEDDDDEPPH